MFKRVTVVLICVLLISFFGWSFGMIYYRSYNYSVINPVPDKIETITLSAAGDCTLGSGANFGYVGHFDWWFKTKANSDYRYFFSGVKHIFDSDDYTFVNLEGTLTNSNQIVKKSFNFKGDPSYVNILLSGGVEGVNLANNHSNDYGISGYNDTMFYLKKANIDYFGYENVLYKEIKGIKFAFVGYTTVGLWPSKKSEIKKTIETIRKEGLADIIVANFHWGIELARKMTNEQIELAHLAVDSGADIVIGHHPHVVQGVEQYKGKYIVYSLGNFVFGGNSYPGKGAWEAIIAQFRLHYRNSLLENISLELVPVSISSISTRNDYKPVVLTGKRRQALIDVINKYSINYRYKEDM